MSLTVQHQRIWYGVETIGFSDYGATKKRMIDPQGAETGPAYQTLGHVDALPAGTMLGEFEVQGLLGFGGFGMVYRCYDHSLQRAVAIKEYMPSALVARTAN